MERRLPAMEGWPSRQAASWQQHPNTICKPVQGSVQLILAGKAPLLRTSARTSVGGARQNGAGVYEARTKLPPRGRAVDLFQQRPRHFRGQDHGCLAQGGRRSTAASMSVSHRAELAR